MSEHNRVDDAASFAISYEESDAPMKMNDVELGEAADETDSYSDGYIADETDSYSDGYIAENYRATAESLDLSIEQMVATNDAADEIHGFDPKRQKRLSRYVAAGLGVFVVVSFLIIAGAMGLFRSDEDGESMGHSDLGSGAHLFDPPSADSPTQTGDADSSPAHQQPNSPAEQPENTGSNNSPNAAGDTGSVEPSYVNVDPSTVPMGENWILRVSAGATEKYTDPSGREWLQDDIHDPSDLFTVHADADDTFTYEECPMDIANSDYAGPGLYCNERNFKEGKAGRYEIPVPSDGIYEFTLHFADIYFDEPGKRVFEVKIENQMMNRNYDIVKAAPRGGNTAKRMRHEQPVTDGSATITLKSHLQHAKISGFEVRRIADLPE